jgi:hypothetical protein
MKKQEKNKPMQSFSPPSSPCVVLFMGIVLCRLQECEVDGINFTVAFGGKQNLPTPMPLFFSFLCLHFVGHVCVDLTITFRRR